MKRFFFILMVVLISSCNNSKKAEVENLKVVKKELRPFFDSDKIDHYYLEFSKRGFEHSVGENAREIEKKKEFSHFFYGNYPDSIPKKSFEKLL